jgi:hypothetical protein
MSRVYSDTNRFILDSTLLRTKKSNIAFTVVLQSARGFDPLCLV